MAEAVVGIAGKIVASLAPQALEYAGKLWGVKDEVEALRDTVSTLQAVLDHAEEQYHRNPQIQVWVDNLKEAFYDAQDVLEEFNIEAMRRELRGQNEVMKEVRTFFSSSNQLVFKMKMSCKLRAVKERIEAIKANKRFHLDERPEREWRKREETHSFVREGDYIGRDKDKKGVMEFLLDLDVQENVSILPIVGIGGLGKTALAQLVYNDEIVSKQFDLKMWVYVSDNFDMTKVIKDMIACAKEKKSIEVAKEQLQDEVRKEIDGKRYLLVLDDVWTRKQEKLLELKNLLMGLGGARGSKILITTRLPLVAKFAGTAPPHYLEALSESASLDLLMQMACQKEEKIQDPEMLAICKAIVRKCVGVPLVIRIVGGILFFKKTKSEWLHFKDNVFAKVSQREDHITSILRLSYDYLPPHLKQCFAFCSLFPKDYEMDKQTLVNLWMAEGFVQPSNTSRHLEDIAHEYFMDLLWSNFFQEYKQDPFTNKETCKMHDLMHDLARLVAGTECWVAWDDEKKTNERTRHVSYVSIIILKAELPISHLKAFALRTFLSTNRGWRMIREADILKLIQTFKMLRVLDLHWVNIKKVPKSICKLKHLTYLDLSGNKELERLPKSITRLQNLQTLSLDGCSALEELPRGIRKLVNLRNLDIDGCYGLRYMPRGMGQLSSLHRLTRFILPIRKTLPKDCCGLGELNGLNDIRGSLCIENLGHERDPGAESGVANLIGKHSLESLELCWRPWSVLDTHDAIIEDRHEAVLGGLRPHSNLKKLTIEGYRSERFSRWMMDSLVSSLPNLVEVHFSCCFRCKHLPPLAQLPHLKILKIMGMDELEYMEPNPSASLTSSLPSLLILDISWCKKLKALPPIPNILTLKITGCKNLKALPPTPHLEELELWGLNNNKEVINHMLGLCKLRTLKIKHMELPECLPEECLKSLTSLQSLDLSWCGGLTSLSRGMRHLSNLVDLSIAWCSELDICKDESGNILDFHPLPVPPLLSLEIQKLPKLESLPPWLLQLTTLERLHIHDCENLKELPEQIEALQSLRVLKISNCPSLTSLPERMRRLTSSLTRLLINDCPRLEELGEENSDSSSSDSVPSLHLAHDSPAHSNDS